MIIAVPPEHALPPRTDGLYQVFLGDCVLPGHLLGTYETAAAADADARRYAEHYGLTGLMCKSTRALPHLTLIQGGRSTPKGSTER
jgi:hypothetical protein